MIQNYVTAFQTFILTVTPTLWPHRQLVIAGLCKQRIQYILLRKLVYKLSILINRVCVIDE